MPPELDGSGNVVGWALIDAIDRWQIRETDVVLVAASLALAVTLVVPHQAELRSRNVRVFALVGPMAIPNPIDLTDSLADETPG